MSARLEASSLLAIVPLLHPNQCFRSGHALRRQLDLAFGIGDAHGAAHQRPKASDAKEPPRVPFTEYSADFASDRVLGRITHVWMLWRSQLSIAVAIQKSVFGSPHVTRVSHSGDTNTFFPAHHFSVSTTR